MLCKAAQHSSIWPRRCGSAALGAAWQDAAKRRAGRSFGDLLRDSARDDDATREADLADGLREIHEIVDLHLGLR